MMLGNAWQISGVYAPKDAEPGDAPVLTATALATSLYSQHHGDRRLAHAWTEPPAIIEQSFRLDDKAVMSPLPMMDAVVTADDGALFVHVVHRSFDQPGTLRLDLSAFADRLAGTATAHRLVPVADDVEGSVFDAMRTDVVDYDDAAAEWSVELPAASISVIRIELKGP